jgi:hypothetical protein
MRLSKVVLSKMNDFKKRDALLAFPDLEARHSSRGILETKNGAKKVLRRFFWL